MDYHRKNENMTASIRQDGYRSWLLVLFENTIAYTTTSVYAGDLVEEQVIVTVRVVNDSWKFVNRTKTGKGLLER